MDWVSSPWFWAGLALALFATEALVPGAFLLWLGLAAAAMVLIDLLLPNLGITAQAIVFAVLAMVSVGVGWRLRGRRVVRNDAPLLNRRSAQLVGRTLPLTQAIVNGRGQVYANDAYWVAEGPDLPEGAAVRVVAADAMTLRVVPAD